MWLFCRLRVAQSCTSVSALFEAALPELKSENRKGTARSTQERYRIDVFRGLWAKLFSTTRVQSPCGGALDSSNSRVLVYSGRDRSRTSDVSLGPSVRTTENQAGKRAWPEAPADEADEDRIRKRENYE